MGKTIPLRRAENRGARPVNLDEGEDYRGNKTPLPYGFRYAPDGSIEHISTPGNSDGPKLGLPVLAYRIPGDHRRRDRESAGLARPHQEQQRELASNRVSAVGSYRWRHASKRTRSPWPSIRAGRQGHERSEAPAHEHRFGQARAMRAKSRLARGHVRASR